MTSPPAPTRGLAVVTGANRGLGLGVVRRLAARGHPVVLGARDATRGHDAAADLPGDVTVRALDVADQGSVDALAAWVRAEHGALEILVNNAGVHYDTGQTAIGADLAIAEEALAVNALGAWRTVVACADLLPHGARVVMVSSGAGSFGETRGGGGVPAYSVSKAALDMVTVKLAADLRPRGVLVNAVCPGWVATDMGGAGGRPVDAGVDSILWAVDLPPDGPTGTFTRDGRTVPW
ncbi:short-chain dehydrogenase [Actinomycetospora sp. NBRC 106375]|uniref:SDR family NAD(P)-dependent oxidoreductase n=1 Tax=Actinomycetospora sp. NBRC 106375 TaxID=3032207 RepID=UPI0024A032D1|nr:SDR family NAD(P)-dependent oxidoreductase [Actinomycetospora sp. NBRC 106375]GLZ45366.1 short-chain dehydrogenase [Actinomycetospora sp. NBRC 106375]